MADRFEPDRNVLYPDRIRRRPEGANSKGLGTHIDAGTFDLWMKAEYQQAFGHVFDGSIEQFDPWSAAHRTSGSQYASTTMTSVFRTFQGWTALSDMDHDQGVLQAVPIPEAIAYLLLRPLLGDVADDDMCGMTAGQVFPVTERWHAPLLEALSGIHNDMVHRRVPAATVHRVRRLRRGLGIGALTPEPTGRGLIAAVPVAVAFVLVQWALARGLLAGSIAE